MPAGWKGKRFWDEKTYFFLTYGGGEGGGISFNLEIGGEGVRQLRIWYLWAMFEKVVSLFMTERKRTVRRNQRGGELFEKKSGEEEKETAERTRKK